MLTWSKRLKYFKSLISLGFFKHKADKFELVEHKNHLALKYKNFGIYSFQILSFGLHQILPLIFSVVFLKNCFLFIDLKKTNMLFLNTLYNIISSTFSFIIYDWAYGIITNFFSIELLNYTYKTVNLPTLSFLLNVSNQQFMVCKELTKKKLLSIGLVSIEEPIFVDYPIFIKNLSEYNSFFLQLVLKIINSNLCWNKKIQK